MPFAPAIRLLLPLVVTLPLVAYWPVTPDAVLINQLLALGLFGALPLVLWQRGWSRRSSESFVLVGAWLLMAIAIAAGRPVGGSGLGDFAVWAAVGTVFCVAVGSPKFVAASAGRGSPHPTPTSANASMAMGWWLAGVLCVAVAVVQYFLPSLADGMLVARNSSPGRAVGNMRQPNHLATALLCAIVMTAWLWQAGRLRASVAGASIVAMVLAVALSASRTGALSLGVLVLWALVDRRLPRSTRWLLALTPLVYLAFWAGLAEYAVWHQAHFYGADRLQSSSDISSSRFAIWKNALSLIAMHPWAGVGWGNFNFAWTFTPFPDRPIAFFDHTHNLVLQLAVEIGLPATAALLGLLLWALWRARGAWHASGADAVSASQAPARAAFMMLVVLGVHSMLEYPLWYAYFLLPAAWTLGVFLGSAPRADEALDRPPSAWPARLLAVAGVVMILGAVYAAWDHRRIEAIFAPAEGAAALDVRIAEGQRSGLFGHHADYAAVTNEPRDQTLATFRRPLQQLVDIRLLIAYIQALKANGRDAEALYAAQRLREFRREDAQAYFKDCAEAAPPFQCETKPVKLTWRDLLP